MATKYDFEIVDANRPADSIFADLQARIQGSFVKTLPAPAVVGPPLKPKPILKPARKRAIR
jgi:hypothetical protein